MGNTHGVLFRDSEEQYMFIGLKNMNFNLSAFSVATRPSSDNGSQQSGLTEPTGVFPKDASTAGSTRRHSLAAENMDLCGYHAAVFSYKQLAF